METDDYLIVVDFEATCDDGGRIQPHEMEIIEIGAVKVNRKTGEVLDSFQSVVCPTIRPNLTSFCMRLTGIQQQDVDAAKTFELVLEDWKAWLGHPFWTYASWGEFDRTILERILLEMGEELIFANHINLKTRAKEVLGLKKTGLVEALRHVGMAFEGRQHRALDDVVNIASLVPFLQLTESP